MAGRSWPKELRDLMLKLGLTGGIASGKSVVAAILRKPLTMKFCNPSAPI